MLLSEADALQQLQDFMRKRYLKHNRKHKHVAREVTVGTSLQASAAQDSAEASSGLAVAGGPAVGGAQANSVPGSPDAPADPALAVSGGASASAEDAAKAASKLPEFDSLVSEPTECEALAARRGIVWQSSAVQRGAALNSPAAAANSATAARVPG